ncbi:Ribosome assembly protein rrb1 [Pestalotiopsis sp. IQ-011]
MPDKITSKNLSYDQSLPPFLARLRGQQAIDAESADPNLAARRRAAKVRSASEEAEDAPVVVDEDGNVVQLKAGQLSDEDSEQQGKDGDDTAAEKKDEPAAEKEKTAGIGAAKKRKVGKVIGADEDDEAGGVDAAIAKAVKATRKLADEPKKETAKAANADNPAGKSGKKKAKKIKLSFGDDEEG